MLYSLRLHIDIHTVDAAVMLYNSGFFYILTVDAAVMLYRFRLHNDIHTVGAVIGKYMPKYPVMPCYNE